MVLTLCFCLPCEFSPIKFFPKKFPDKGFYPYLPLDVPITGWEVVRRRLRTPLFLHQRSCTSLSRCLLRVTRSPCGTNSPDTLHPLVMDWSERKVERGWVSPTTPGVSARRAPLFTSLLDLPVIFHTCVHRCSVVRKKLVNPKQSFVQSVFWNETTSLVRSFPSVYCSSFMLLVHFIYGPISHYLRYPFLCRPLPPTSHPPPPGCVVNRKWDLP